MKLSEMSQSTKKEEKINYSKTEKDLKNNYDQLKDCSADELMQKLFQEVKMQKDRGIFDYDGLKNTIEQAKIYLPEQTYENILRIVESLK